MSKKTPRFIRHPNHSGPGNLSQRQSDPNDVLLKSSTGAVLMNLEKFGRQDRYMIIEGMMVDSWRSKIYVDYEDAYLMFKKLFTKEMLIYMILVPIWILKKRFFNKV